MRVADIPGLISGAHSGVGLGHSFLRHVERSSFLVFVIDMAGADGRNPVDDYRALREELALYRDDIISRPSLLVANKMDVPEATDNLEVFKRETGTDPLLVSTLDGTGIQALRKALHVLRAKTLKNKETAADSTT